MVLPAAGEDLGAVGREADVRDAAALPGQQAEAASVRLEVQAQRLSERGRIQTWLIVINLICIRQGSDTQDPYQNRRP